MALSYVFGTVGSGKTYDMLVRMMADMKAGHEVVTINCRLKLDLVRKYLIEVEKMPHYDADRVCGYHRTITTEDEFRRLQGRDNRRIKLHVDEAHFWWPTNGHYKASIDDVFAVAMSRKRKVDVHMVSQRYGQINRDIAGYCHEVWKAMKFTMVPILLYCHFRTKIMEFGGHPEWTRPTAFLYMKKIGDLGNETLDIDKADISNKRIRFLHPRIAELYETEEIVSSPVLDRVKRETELDYLRDVLFNRIKPSSTCPDCEGTRRRKMGLAFNPDLEILERVVATSDNMRSPWFWKITGEEACERCMELGQPRGYIYPDDHPDYAEAEKVRHYFTSDGKRKSSRALAN